MLKKAISLIGCIAQRGIIIYKGNLSCIIFFKKPRRDLGACIPQRWHTCFLASSPTIFLLMLLGFIDCTAQNSGQGLVSVNQTHLVQASGKLVPKRSQYTLRESGHAQPARWMPAKLSLTSDYPEFSPQNLQGANVQLTQLMLNLFVVICAGSFLCHAADRHSL